MHPVNIITSTWDLLSSSFCVATLGLLVLNELLIADETGQCPGTHDKIAFTVMA
jgi:hypothetical protein